VYVQTFPKCCGAGVLVIEHLTGKGEAADLELIKQYVSYARRNGYRMYDFPQEYGAGPDVQAGAAIIGTLGGKGDQSQWNTHNSWGMLLAITDPSRKEAGKRLAQFGFKELLTTNNPVYYGQPHPITLWGLDLNQLKKEDLAPAKPENPFVTMTGTLGCLAAKQLKARDAKGRFTAIEKAPVPCELQEL